MFFFSKSNEVSKYRKSQKDGTKLAIRIPSECADYDVKTWMLWYGMADVFVYLFIYLPHKYWSHAAMARNVCAFLLLLKHRLNKNAQNYSDFILFSRFFALLCEIFSSDTYRLHLMFTVCSRRKVSRTKKSTLLAFILVWQMNARVSKKKPYTHSQNYHRTHLFWKKKNWNFKFPKFEILIHVFCGSVFLFAGFCIGAVWCAFLFSLSPACSRSSTIYVSVPVSICMYIIFIIE